MSLLLVWIQRLRNQLDAIDDDGVEAGVRLCLQSRTRQPKIVEVEEK